MDMSVTNSLPRRLAIIDTYIKTVDGQSLREQSANAPGKKPDFRLLVWWQFKES